MLRDLYRRIFAWCKAGRYRSIAALAVLTLLIFGIILGTADFIHSRNALEPSIARNSYGKGTKTEHFRVKNEEEMFADIEVEISEQMYTDQEIQSMFARCSKNMERYILGENESLDQITSDMNLLTSMPQEPVEISWQLDRYDVMNIYGELIEKDLSKDGVLVKLTGTMSYTQNEEKKAIYESTVRVLEAEKSEKELFARQVKEVLSHANEEQREKAVVSLPDKVNKKAVSYYPLFEKRGLVLCVMALLIGILLFALEKQNIGLEKKKRQEQMRRDYPEVLNKLTLLLGAGMTIKRAFHKIVEDYERQKEFWGTRYAYEEMKQTCNEMDSGITELESYERYGHRCQLQEYMKLSALLSQNIRKGTKGVSRILNQEAANSFEERKARARQLGEEAGTKLLIPMFLMLAVVLVIVIVPAFLSIQM